MKTIIQILPLFVLSLALISCGGEGGGGSSAAPAPTPPPETPEEEEEPIPRPPQTPSFDVTLDSELTQAERLAMNNSTDLLEKLQIDGSQVAGFSQIFKGKLSSNVVNYLEQRVNYVISQFTNHPERIIYPNSSARNNFETFASNDSVGLWYFDKYYEEEGGIKYIISGRPREISSSQVGIVQLGDIFTTSDTITQAITLVHEARHSDCPDGAILSDVINFAESGANYNVIQNVECGQLHSRPDGGDAFAWGPYLIDFIYSKTIADTCSNCTQTQIQQAQLNANMVQGRAYDINGTINGIYGPPDMSNSNDVRDDL